MPSLTVLDLANRTPRMAGKWLKKAPAAKKDETPPPKKPAAKISSFYKQPRSAKNG